MRGNRNPTLSRSLVIFLGAARLTLLLFWALLSLGSGLFSFRENFLILSTFFSTTDSVICNVFGFYQNEIGDSFCGFWGFNRGVSNSFSEIRPLPVGVLVPKYACHTLSTESILDFSDFAFDIEGRKECCEVGVCGL